MSTLDKVRWTLGLIVIFLLLLLTGRSNVHNSKKIQAAIESIYADRLLVKDLIFDLAEVLQEKELALAKGDLDFFRLRAVSANTRALELLAAFRATVLVPLEEATLERFETGFDALVSAEAELELDVGAALQPSDVERMSTRIDGLQADLEVLSKIQIDEARRQLMLGDKAVSEMDLMATIETYMLAFIGILAMGMILFIPKHRPSE
jgi:hypothetical protein